MNKKLFYYLQFQCRALSCSPLNHVSSNYACKQSGREEWDLWQVMTTDGIKTCRIQHFVLIPGVHRKSVVLLNMASQFIGIITMSHDSSISAMAARADLHRCSRSFALTWAVIKLLGKHCECYWLCGNCTHIQPLLRHLSINIMTLPFSLPF